MLILICLLFLLLAYKIILYAIFMGVRIKTHVFYVEHFFKFFLQSNGFFLFKNRRVNSF